MTKLSSFKNFSEFEFDFIDIETHEDDSFYFLYVYGDNFDEAINSWYEFFDLVVSDSYIKKKNRYLFYGHYAGAFDYLYMLDWIAENNVIDLASIRIIDSSGLIIRIVFEYQGVTFDFRDSYALSRMSLNSWASKLLNEQKIDIDIEHRDSIDRNKFIEYCRRDCQLGYKCVKKYAEIFDNNVKITISSQAVDLFRRHFLKTEWPQLSHFWYKQMRHFYYGGRVEVFKRYGENVISYDINQAYGFIMKEFGAPVGLPRLGDKFEEDKVGFYVIRLKKIPEFFIPSLGAKLNFMGQKSFMFCNSKEIDYYVTNFDLLNLIEKNVDFKILISYIYDYDKMFFQSFVDYCYSQISYDDNTKPIWKLVVNSLYGKLGQNRTMKQIKIAPDSAYYYDENFKIGYSDVYYQTDFSNPQISAWITSGCRYLLNSYLQKYQDNLYYCDTDSLFLDIEPSDDISNIEMGKLKIEKVCKKLYVVGNKFYGYIDENDNFQTVIKGFPARIKGKEVGIFSEDQFKAAIFENKFDFKYTTDWKVSKFKSAIRESNRFLNIKRNTTKEIKRSIVKRKIKKDGINTRPFYYINSQFI